VILEAGASGIPTVSTDVGSCRELVLGRSDEAPALGHGGDITPLCNPSATAQALARLLTDTEWYARCSQAIAERVRRYYNKTMVDASYRELYEQYLAVDARRLERPESLEMSQVFPTGLSGRLARAERGPEMLPLARRSHILDARRSEAEPREV
jgi:hypothetical protein